MDHLSHAAAGAAGLEDKENCSPCPTTSLYPKLPRPLPPPPPPPPPLRPRPRDGGDDDDDPVDPDAGPSPLRSHGQAPRRRRRTPGPTPNTGRKRRALATAPVPSPPRPSYANKVKGIFREPVPVRRRRSDGGVGVGSTPPTVAGLHPGGAGGGATPWSPLSGGSDRTDEDRRCARGGGVSVGSAEKKGECGEDDDGGPGRVPSVPTAHGDRGLSLCESPEEQPLRDLEEACASPSPAFGPVTHACSHVPRSQEPLPAADESSDSWTGDDEFLPRCARRQKRLDRERRSSPTGPPPPPSSSTSARLLLRPEAPTYRGIGQAHADYPWPTTLFSKPTRFQAMTSSSAIIYPELPRCPFGGGCDLRASDADDEESNSP